MSEISKEALAAACAEKIKQLELSVKQSAFDSVRQELETELAIARVALLALRERAEPVAWIAEYHGEVNDDITGRTRSAVDAYADKYGWEPALTEITPLYAAPPAPVVVDAAAAIRACMDEFPESVHDIVEECADIAENAFRAAMLQPVSQPYKLPEWTNEQCLEFRAVAFRHAEIKGDFELDDLRMGVKMANAMTPVKEVN
ncbi:hypothetical protein SNN69_001503 [Cronobacter sakazakii]|nr:hypothetical protein [Cronobacter sakazakii]